MNDKAKEGMSGVRAAQVRFWSWPLQKRRWYFRFGGFGLHMFLEVSCCTKAMYTGDFTRYYIWKMLVQVRRYEDGREGRTAKYWKVGAFYSDQYT